MLVHLTTHLEAAIEDSDDLRAIVKTVEAEGHVLAQDWISNNESLRVRAQEGLNWQQIYHASIDAIERADVVISESSGFGCFGVGFQAALALQKKKPLLILRHASLVPEKGAFSGGVDDMLAQIYDYESQEDLCKAVKSFLIENSNAQKDLRFNFVIDRQIHNHLKWRSFKTGKTKAEVVRDLLLKDMEKDD